MEEWMRRKPQKPLFPCPEQTIIDPVTKQPVTKKLGNKGRQPTTVLTINGSVKFVRRWWHSMEHGSVVPADERFILTAQQTAATPTAFTASQCLIDPAQPGCFATPVCPSALRVRSSVDTKGLRG